MPADDMLKFDKRKAARSHIKKADHKPHAGPEDVLQRQCEEVLKIKKLWYIHFPNALFKGKIAWIGKLFKGWPDLLIFARGEEFDRVFFAELKRDVGKPTGGQKLFARWFHVYLIKSLDDFVEVLNKFIGDRTRGEIGRRS